MLCWRVKQILKDACTPSLKADERVLKQIFLNIFSNAIKFTPAGGRVDLDVTLDGTGDMRFRFTDTGTGIAAEDIPKILQPFVQADSSLARKHEGTGLGLPLSKSLVELHGGTLEIDSTFGAGTTVTVTFPAERVGEVGATGPLRSGSAAA